MKINFLYLLLSLFLFGSFSASHDNTFLKDQHHYTQSPYSTSYDHVSEEVEINEQELDFDDSLFVNSYVFQLFTKRVIYKVKFSQTNFCQGHVGGHSGLSPPLSPIS